MTDDPQAPKRIEADDPAFGIKRTLSILVSPSHFSLSLSRTFSCSLSFSLSCACNVFFSLQRLLCSSLSRAPRCCEWRVPPQTPGDVLCVWLRRRQRQRLGAHFASSVAKALLNELALQREALESDFTVADSAMAAVAADWDVQEWLSPQTDKVLGRQHVAENVYHLQGAFESVY